MSGGKLERWKEIEPILEGALDLAPAERAAFVARACADDSDLLQAVQRLLAADRDAAAFLETPPGADAFELLADLAGDESFAAPAHGSLEGRQIGQYRVLSELGSGGMSDVYLAERVGAAFEQRVALKVLRAQGGMREERERRFHAERRLLAALEHPNIARIIDGGTFDEDRQYLAMEHVDGLPLDRYCQDHGLDLAARLGLFLQVCEAVHYAHQRLIVHRDLKPSNILVDGAGRPRLLDFGIAKQLAEASDEPAGPHTRTGLMLMTPEYAAPEQVLGKPVTTATDVYALGVVLYELVAGCRPFALLGRTPSEIEEIVCHRPPEDPSHAQSSISRREPLRITRDLDVIAQKALSKEPERRYGTAAELAEDIQRLLTGHPVKARPATRGYRAARFIRRHRWGVSMATAAVAGVVAFAGVLAVQYRQTALERDRTAVEAARAGVEATRAGAVTRFLLELFAASDPDHSLGEALTARELLDRGRTQVDSFVGPPAVKAAMQDAIGAAYKGLGLLDEADGLLQSALSFQEGEAPDSLALAAAAERLATLRMDQGRWDEAATLMDRVLSLRQKLLPSNDPLVAEALYHQGIAFRLLARYEEAEARFREALRMQRSAVPVDTDAVEESLGSLGIALAQQGRLEESERAFREALQLAQEIHPAGHPGVLTALNNLAVLLSLQGKLEEAVVIDREVVEHRRRVLGPRHPQTSASLSNLGQKLLSLERFDEAEAAISEALAIDRELNDQGSPDLAISLSNMGWLRHMQGSFDEALDYHRSALQMRRELLGERHSDVATSLRSLGWVLRDAGDLEAARPFLESSLEVRTEIFGADHQNVAEVQDLLGVLELRAGNFELAKTLLEQALATREARLPADHPDIAATREHLAELNGALGESSRPG